MMDHQDVRERYRAAEGLSVAQDEASLLALVEALADEGEYEEPGDPGAPPFFYLVAAAARQSLGDRVVKVLEPLAQVMRRSPLAAQQGAALLPRCGSAGLPLMLDTLRHFHPWGREAAVKNVRALLKVCQGEAETRPLVEGLLAALNDDDSGVTFAALHEVRSLRGDYLKWAPVGLVEALVQRMQAEPTAGTRAEVCEFFGDRPLVRQGWVELAAAGYPRPAELLVRWKDVLTPQQVEILGQGQLSVELLRLLGQLGGAGVAPRLLAILNDAKLGPTAAVALLQMGATVPARHIQRVFLASDDRYQAALVRVHPQPQKLAEKVLPVLRQRWQERGDRAALRAVRALGKEAVSELPWLLELLKPYAQPPYPCWEALEIIASFGSDARPAFGAMAVLLDHNDHRGSVLKALTRLGPVAREEFLPLLEVLDLESARWLVWQRNWWQGELTRALQALRA